MNIKIPGFVTEEQVYFPEVLNDVPVITDMKAELHMNLDMYDSLRSASVLDIQVTCKHECWHQDLNNHWKVFITEGQLIPDWYINNCDKYVNMIRGAFAEWFSHHVRVNQSIQELDSSCYLLKGCQVKMLNNSVQIAYAEDSVIETMSGGATIFNMNNTTVERMCQASKIYVSNGSSHIYMMTDDSMIKLANDETEISAMIDRSRVEDLRYFASIISITDECKVDHCAGKIVCRK